MITDSQFLCEDTMYLSELKKEMEPMGISIDLMPLMKTPWAALEGKLPLERAIKTALLVPAVRNCDIVHVQFTFPMGFLLSLLRHVHGKPVIIHTHGDDVFVVTSAGIGFRRYFLGRLATKISWETTSHIIAVCRRAEEEILKTGVSPSKVSVLYNGVNENFFYRTNPEGNQSSNIRGNSDFVFLNVGGLKQVKNQMRLLKAFSMFVKNSRINSRLVICGSGHLDRALHDFAHKLAVSNRVIFLGSVQHNQMPKLYSAVDAFILPSLHEAHPWSILEAMSCELSVAASDVGGIPETIDNEKLLINPLEIADISRAIHYLAEDPKRSRAIGTGNRRTIIENYTLRQHAARLKSIYSRV